MSAVKAGEEMTAGGEANETAVRYWDYLRDYRRHREELLAVVDSVLSSGRLILGKRVESLENKFSLYCGARFGVGVNSGTDALFLSLKALGIGEGDEVVTVANTAVPTVAAIRSTGATPVFVDVEPDTFLMDVRLLPQVLTSRTRCVLPVHLCGQPVDLAPLQEFAELEGVEILEDCAQAAGATYRGRRVGSFGSIGAFSFYPTKILGGYGDGGMAVTSCETLYRKLKRLRFYGMEGAYCSEEEGYNSRLDELQAALLDFRLGLLEEEVGRRRAIAAMYSEHLSGVGDLVLPAEGKEREHRFYLYTIRTSFRGELMAFLAEKGVETRVNYPTPIHLMPGYRFLGYREGSLPVTERLAGEILSLPMYHDLSDHEVWRVIEEIRCFFARDLPSITRPA
ncbi:DegT/DnrJ/EryC1/StrS aminotransferase family protein [Geobacter sp. DSM 9736]|uniref:DegT/DnrJ/EryC1/StrS family aminotransferase n=1 Tax=Geobacter sp. DSM 9736 TaxID=1277350 RepID=UPI000B50939B|nr:DegT/DnrJ/EryC1/StrS family aminotransferase [Geobacter sp. DSM 9736]SNB44904.1 aminotransferase EvaB [Geobacter sp. DSM 9736]